MGRGDRLPPYDMAHDPLEMHDLAAEKPEMLAKLKADYDAWFSDVTGARGITACAVADLCRRTAENPILLTRQDWRGDGADWSPKGIGHWEVNVVTAAATRSRCASTPSRTTRRPRWSAAPFRERAAEGRCDGRTLSTTSACRLARRVLNRRSWQGKAALGVSDAGNQAAGLRGSALI